MRRGRKPKEYDLELAAAWFRAVVHPRARCAGCGARRSLQAHHALPKTHIESFCRSARLNNADRNILLWHADNGVALCLRCHERHTNAAPRLSVAKLPAAAWSFARTLNVLAVEFGVRGYGPEWATERLRREYAA